jgi:hypothetical protein
MNRRTCILLLVLLGLILAGVANSQAQTAGLGLDPGRMEVEMKPGQEKTIAFTIDSPSSEIPVRGRLLLSLTDWDVNQDTSISYADPGSMKNSASPWVVFSPAAVNISSGEKQVVRVTVRVPQETAAGVYRTAIFIQERPPAAAPQSGEQLLYIRFRYVFFLYVVIPPVSLEPALTGLRLVPGGDGLHVVCDLANHGSRHVRPLITVSIRNSHQDEIKLVRNYEGTVLLPFSTIREAFHLKDGLAPDSYEISAQVDFQDNGPLQSMHRTVDLSAAN